MSAMEPLTQRTDPTPLKRRLAIVFGDIAGISSLMADVGDLLVANALQQFFRRLDRFQATHHGRLTKALGDGFLAAFEDVSNAFAFAVTLQQSLSQDPIAVVRPEESPRRDRELSLRVSVHLGPVLVMNTTYGEDIFGPDVNLAARMSEIAKPGQILVSGPACLALPADQQAILRPAETVVQLKGLSGSFEFSTVDVAGV